jgi:hypothetical protein
MKQINLTMLLNLFHTICVNANSLAGFSSLKSKRMCAAQRHFLCPKFINALLFFIGRICGRLRPAGSLTRSANPHYLPTCAMAPATDFKLSKT